MRADRATWIVGARRAPRAARDRPRARRPARSPAAPGSSPARARTRARRGAAARAGCSPTPSRTGIGGARRRPAPRPALGRSRRWRDPVVGPRASPPAVTPASPLLALVDSQLDPDHPEFAGSQHRDDRRPAAGRLPRHGDRRRRRRAAERRRHRSASGRARARSTSPLPRRRSPARTPRAASPRAIRARRRRDQHELRLARRAARPSTTRSSARSSAGAVPVAASGNEFDQGNPLEFPAQPAARAHRRGARAATDKPTVLLQRERARSTSAPRAWASSPRSRVAFDPTTARATASRSLAGHVVRRADGRRPRSAWVRAARPDAHARPGRAGRPASARGHRRAGLRDATGFGVLDLAGRARRSRRRPTTRSSPTTTSASSTAARSARRDRADLHRQRATRPLRDGSTSPRTRSTSTAIKIPAAPTGADHAHAALRRPRPLRLQLAGAQRVRRSAASASLAQRRGAGPTRVHVRNRGRRRDVLRRRRLHGRKRLQLLNAAYALSRAALAPCRSAATLTARGRLVVRPLAPRRGRPCPRAPPASGPAGCRAGTTRRRARPGSRSRRR